MEIAVCIYTGCACYSLKSYSLVETPRKIPLHFTTDKNIQNGGDMRKNSFFVFLRQRKTKMTARITAAQSFRLAFIAYQSISFQR